MTLKRRILRILLMTLYATGARRAEVAHLKVSDINSQPMVMHMRDSLSLSAIASGSPNQHQKVLLAITRGVLSPAFAAIILGVAKQPQWTRFLTLAPLVLLGEASYSLYLLHSFVMTKAFDAMSYLPFAIRVALCVGAAIGASLASYEFIEQPARRFLQPRKANSCSACQS